MSYKYTHTNGIRKTTKQFIAAAVAVHGDRYDYSLVEYINSKTKVLIICAEEGVCLQRPDHHLEGQKCRKYNKKENKLLYYKQNIPLFNTYEKQLTPYGVSCRKYKDDDNILEIQCYYCHRWFIPFATSVDRKIQSLKTINVGERNLYCSDICKGLCPTYKQITVRKGNKVNKVRANQTELRKLVLKRDDYTCQICGSVDKLHCHHIDPVISNPLESVDVDNCITVCKICHNKVHTLPGCGYSELKRCLTE